MQLTLLPHPATPAADPRFNVWVTVEHAGSLGSVASTNIWFGVGAPAERFIIPAVGEPARADELWRKTCFEAFLRAAGAKSYREWNFAPSGEWAAYDFAAYRDKAGDPEVAAPYIRMEDNLTWWALGATIAVEAEHEWQVGFSAVLEERDGTRSYWALAHAGGETPDFHDPACFAAHLP